GRLHARERRVVHQDRAHIGVACGEREFETHIDNSQRPREQRAIVRIRIGAEVLVPRIEVDILRGLRLDCSAHRGVTSRLSTRSDESRSHTNAALTRLAVSRPRANSGGSISPGENSTRSSANASSCPNKMPIKSLSLSS